MTEDTQTEKPELMEVQDVHTFVALITHWHTSKVRVLEHMVSVPEGTVIQIDDCAETSLEGAMLDGFKAGLSLALMELGQLPFVTSSTEVPTQH